MQKNIFELRGRFALDYLQLYYVYKYDKNALKGASLINGRFAEIGYFRATVKILSMFKEFAQK